MKLFVVSSPLQLRSALKIIDTYKYHDHLVAIKFSTLERDNENDRQLNEAYVTNVERYSFYLISAADDNASKFIIDHFRFFKLWLMCRSNVSEIYFGSFYNYYFSMVRILFGSGVDNYLIDDGMATVTAQISYISQRVYIKYPKNRLLKLVFKAVESIFGKVKGVDVVSYYDVSCYLYPTQNYIPVNTFSQSTSAKDNVSDEISFVGCPFSENKIVSLEDEVAVLKKFYLSCNNKRVIYYPHRYDSDVKLSLIAEIGYDVITIQRPLEEYFMTLDSLSATYASFTSTVLYHVSRSYGNLNVKYIDPTPYMTSSENKEKFGIVVEYFEGLGFEKIFV